MKWGSVALSVDMRASSCPLNCLAMVKRVAIAPFRLEGVGLPLRPGLPSRFRRKKRKRTNEERKFQRRRKKVVRSEPGTKLRMKAGRGLCSCDAFSSRVGHHRVATTRSRRRRRRRRLMQNKQEPSVSFVSSETTRVAHALQSKTRQKTKGRNQVQSRGGVSEPTTVPPEREGAAGTALLPNPHAPQKNHG